MGEGTFNGQPSFAPNSTSKPAWVNPSLTGPDLYIALQYRFARAATWRYKPFILNGSIGMLQLENELNEAFLAAVAGDRPFSVHWADWRFLTNLLAALRQAVLDEIPPASGFEVSLTTNLHTDVPESAHRLLNLTGFYVDAAKMWAPIVNGLLSIDAYPNMYVATLNVSHQVVDRVKVVQAIVAASSSGDPSRVFVMETGYPVDVTDATTATNTTTATTPAPSVFDFSEDNQAQYVQRVREDLEAAGAAGMLYFKMVRSPGMTPPPGGYTSGDISLFKAIQAYTEAGEDVGVLVEWLLQPGSLEEALTRAAYLVRRPSAGGWGLVRQDGSARPALWALSP